MAQAIAASISQTTGPVSVVRDGQTITLNKGDSVYATDTIKTGKETVEIKFVDGASATLSAETIMTVQEFSVNLDAPAFVLNLAIGAMRTVSGEVVEQNPDAFKIITPRATVGIRGTIMNSMVNPDGSESIVVESLSQGHNVVVASINGTIFSITTTNQGVVISAEDSADASLREFSDSEMQALVSFITGALEQQTTDEDETTAEEEEEDTVSDDEELEEVEEDTDADEVESDTDSSIELDQSVLDALGEDATSDLIDALEDLGVDVVGLGEDLTNELDERDDAPEAFVVPQEYEDGLLVVNISGNESFYADASITSGVAANQRVIIQNNIASGSNVIITADVNEHTSGSLVAGNDEIIAKNMAGGRLAGDANIVSGGSFTAGGDLITATSKTGGNSIYGDMFHATGGNVTFGNDTITVTGALENSIIAGDANTVDLMVNGKFGNDVISVASMGAGAEIYGDAKNSNFSLAAGANTITVHGEMSAGIITGGEGNDAINIGTFTSGNIDGGGGDDTLTITGTLQNSLSFSSVNTPSNIEHFVFNNLANYGVAFDPAHATGVNITVKASNGGNVSTGVGGDVITAASGVTLLTVSSAVGGTDTINHGAAGTVELSGANQYHVNYVTHGTLEHNSNGAVTVATLSGGNVEFNSAGNRTITINDMSAGTVTGTGSSENISIGNMSGGTVYAGTDTVGLLDPTPDTISINVMSGGIINTGSSSVGKDSEADTVTITTMNGGTIIASDGKDNITITNAITQGNITIENSFLGLDDAVELEFTNGISGGIVNLTGLGVINLAENLIVSGGTLNIGSKCDANIETLSGGAINVTNQYNAIEINKLSGGNVLSAGGSITLTSLEITSNANISNSNGANFNVNLILESVANSTAGAVLNLSATAGKGFDVSGGIDSSTGDVETGFNLSKNITINGSSAADTFTLSSMTTGAINGGAGNDTVFFLNASTVDLSSASITNVETISFGDISSGNITGTNSNDTFTFGNVLNTDINAADGSDSLTITTLNGGTINGGGDDGQDTLSIGTLNGTSTTLENFAEVWISNLGTNASYSTKNVGAVNLSATDGDDNLSYSFNLSNTVIDAKAGKDTITVTGDMYDSTIKAGLGGGNISVTGSLDGSQYGTKIIGSTDAANTITVDSRNGQFLQSDISGGELGDNITITVSTVSVTEIDSAEILGLGGNDTITFNGTFTSSSNPIDLNGGAGDDVINLNGDLKSGGWLKGGDGNDLITVTGLIENTGSSPASIDTGAGQDTVIVHGTLDGDTQSTVKFNNDGPEVDTLQLLGGLLNSGSFVYFYGDGGFDIQGSADGYVLDKGFLRLASGGEFSLGSITGTDNTNHGSVQSWSNTKINLSVENLTGYGTIQGSDGADTINVTFMEGATIDGNGGGDIVNITTLNGRNNTFRDIAELRIDSVNSGAEYTLHNVGEFYIDDILQEGGNISRDNLTDATLNGNENADNIRIDGTISNGQIFTKGGDDIIFANGFNEGKIDGGAGTDELTVRNIVKGEILNIENVTIDGNISSESADIVIKDATNVIIGPTIGTEMSDGKITFDNGNIASGVTVSQGFNVTGGEVTFTAYGDNITLYNFAGGLLKLGDGNDTLNITTFDNVGNAGENNPTISLDGGNDTITIASVFTTGVEHHLNIENESAGDRVVFLGTIYDITGSESGARTITGTTDNTSSLILYFD